MKKKNYKTIFISDVHLWHFKNQSDKLIEFLESITFKNLIIVWDFIDYWRLGAFWEWSSKETRALNYINDLSKKWINITYITWNHDCKIRCNKNIHFNNMTFLLDMYYKTNNNKIYYVAHWDCLDNINNNYRDIWKIWSLMHGLLIWIEHIWNKKVKSPDHLSFAEKVEDWVKIHRFPPKKFKRKFIKFSKKLKCDGIIFWHFHQECHCNINWLDYYNTWDWLRRCSAVAENEEWNLELIKYNWETSQN